MNIILLRDYGDPIFLFVGEVWASKKSDGCRITEVFLKVILRPVVK
jgi:hypothetical protein